MLTDIPRATQYTLIPIAEPKENIPVGDERLCGDKGSTLTFSQLLFNEIAKVMGDDDVVAIGGVVNARMVILVNFTKKHAENLIQGGLMALDEVWQAHPNMIPEGGVLHFRNWDDIPDEEKAGHDKK